MNEQKITSNFFSFFFLIFKILHNCISFAKYQNESTTGIHVFPILNPPPSSHPKPALWVVPVHQPQASSIVHRTWTGNSFHTWHFTCFNAILPSLPTLSLSHRVHKTVLQTISMFLELNGQTLSYYEVLLKMEAAWKDISRISSILFVAYLFFSTSGHGKCWFIEFFLIFCFSFIFYPYFNKL